MDKYDMAWILARKDQEVNPESDLEELHTGYLEWSEDDLRQTITDLEIPEAKVQEYLADCKYE